MDHVVLVQSCAVALKPPSRKRLVLNDKTHGLKLRFIPYRIGMQRKVLTQSSPARLCDAFDSHERRVGVGVHVVEDKMLTRDVEQR